VPTGSELALAGLILIVGLLYSSVGHAGASGYLAAMGLMGVAPGAMKPTALILNILVAAIGTIQFRRAGHFDWKLFWPFAVASVPLAFLGGMVDLPPEYYKPFIGLVLVFSAWRIAAAARSSCVGERPTKRVTMPMALGAGATLGFISGMTGVGGGIFLSPLLLLCRWAEPKKAAAASAAFILVNSISGIAGWASKSGSTPPAMELLLPLCTAAAIGGAIGSYLGSRRFDPRMIRWILAVVLVIAGGKLVWEGVETMGHAPRANGKVPMAKPEGAH
jgi:hypothetical protein